MFQDHKANPVLSVKKDLREWLGLLDPLVLQDPTEILVALVPLGIVACKVHRATVESVAPRAHQDQRAIMDQPAPAVHPGLSDQMDLVDHVEKQESLA